VTRTLKVFHHLCDHGLPVSHDALLAFKRIEAFKDEIGDAFALLKERIDQVSTWI
jgi:hypothetical protein